MNPFPMRPTALLCLAGLALAGASATAQTLLLSNAVVHTVSGDVIRDGQVLIRKGKIRAVGKDIELPRKLRKRQVVNLEGMNLYPGLIAATTSMGLTEINAVRATRDYQEVGTFTPDVYSWLAVNPDSTLIPVARANGITHFVPVPRGGTVSGFSGVMATGGWTVEDMVIKKVSGLHLDWPSMRINTTPKDEFKDKSKYKSPDKQAKERKERIKRIDDFFDEAEAYLKARGAARSEERLDSFAKIPAWEALLPVLERRVPIMIRAHDLREIKAAAAWAEKRNYRIVMVGGTEAWRVADLLAEKEIPVVYEATFVQPLRDTDPCDAQFKAPAVLTQAGVKTAISMGVGSFDSSNLRNLPYTAAHSLPYGWSPAEALKSITLEPAEVLGVGDRLGSIEPGKDATLIAVQGDLLDIRSQVKRMWIGGQETSLESRHTQLYQRYKNRPLPK